MKRQLISEYIAQLEMKCNPTVEFLKTGIDSMDGLMNGVAMPSLNLVISRQANGHSAFGLSLFKAFTLLQKIPALYCTTYLFSTDVLNSIIGSELEIEVDKFNYLSAQEIKDIQRYVKEKLENAPLFVLDTSCSFLNLLHKIEVHILKDNLRVIFIDYFQLYHNNPKISRNKIFVALHKLSVEYKIAIFLFYTLNSKKRDLNQYEPAIYELNEFEALRKIPNTIISLFRPEYYGIKIDDSGYSTAGQAQITILKNDFGKTEQIYVNIKLKYNNFFVEQEKPPF
ncbi:MAG: DnaB-like helicase C-terminal domain-containing protein [Thermonemataceae bacterium]|nr:DnaB-like helicase C-terminal domain-containing protein [Thermonemataceae bacterium]